MGSGSLAAMAVFEAGWKPNMEVSCPVVRFLCLPLTKTHLHIYMTLQRQEALGLVTDAISAGIFNDLGSGSNIDACVITATGTEMLRNFVKPNERVEKERSYVFRRGTTAFKSETIRNLIVEEEVKEVKEVKEGEAMDTS